MMTYAETTEYLFNRMPMFERQGASGYKEGLSNTIALDEHFGHPHRKYKTIHVAGTNGKGSCSHTLAAILQGYGLNVGLYTSPHLLDFRERIRINGESIDEEYVVDFVDRERAFFEPLYPSFFEVTTALAFKYFADMGVDIAIIEVGLGGRLDCTNIITPILSIITNISLDHTQFLGNTIAEIASEKAGIIKSGVPVVVGESTADSRKVFEMQAMAQNSPIIFAEDCPEVISHALTSDDSSGTMRNGISYSTVSFGTISGDLGGDYQRRNTNTILCAYKKLIEDRHFKSDTNVLKDAFSNVCTRTGFLGRWQVVNGKPLTVCDTAHNIGGWEYLSKQIAQTKCNHKHIIFGMMNDKDVDKVLALIPKDATYHFTQVDVKRAMPSEEIVTLAKKHGLTGHVYPNVKEAYTAALAAAQEDDFIFIGGSNYVVADFLKVYFH